MAIRHISHIPTTTGSVLDWDSFAITIFRWLKIGKTFCSLDLWKCITLPAGDDIIQANINSTILDHTSYNQGNTLLLVSRRWRE